MSDNVQGMQIFNIIGQIEEFVENSPKPKIGGGANKKIIDAEELMDLLGDLKVTIPEDIRRANSVIIQSNTMIENADEHARDVVAEAEKNSDLIIAKANTDAAEINAKAQAEYERLISEDEIYQEAQRRAKLLAMKAEANADMVFQNAKLYADDVLKDLESFLGEYKQLVAINRQDLDARTASPNQPTMQTEPPRAEPERMSAAQPAATPAQTKPAAHTGKRPVEPTVEDDDDFDDDDENEGGGFFSKLFKKKKKDDDFDDEEDI